MILWSHQRRRKVTRGSLFAWLWVCLFFNPAIILADEVPAADLAVPSALEQRIRQLEQNQQSLLEQNSQLSAKVQSLSGSNRNDTSDPALSSTLPAPTGSSDQLSMDQSNVQIFDPASRSPANIFASHAFDTAEEFPLERRTPPANTGSKSTSFFATFDRGFVIRPIDADETPFELKINGQNQFRYVGYDREHDSWTDSAGITTQLSNMSSFQIPRGRIIFSGFTFRKELLYNLNIDYNTVGNSQINFRAYWLAWRFSRAMTVYAGQSKVPGSREWLLSFVDTLGVDRSMATTFFRPSLSQGLWATGEPADGLFYHVMMSNGFNTLGSTPQQLSSLMAFSGSVWWEPLGNFGAGYSDFQWHEEPAIRVGTSLTYAPEQGPQGSSSVPENSLIRLSDGTLITETGALAPGVTLNKFKIGLATIDLAYKYRGVSLSGEFYWQNLFALGPSGPIPQNTIQNYGGFVQAGYFVIPQKLEPYLRTSVVTGPNGTGAEYAGGGNWFFLPAKHTLRFTFDAAWLDNCPADQNRTNFQAGQSGLLVRSQVQIFF